MSDQYSFNKSTIPKSPRNIRTIDSFAPTSNIYYQKPDYEPPHEIWMPIYLRCLHILAVTYDPDRKMSESELEDLRKYDPNTSDINQSKRKKIHNSMKCFIESLAELLPSNEMSNMLQEFILMTPTTRKNLFNCPTLKSFFTVNNEIINVINYNPSSFLDYCLTNSETFFMWTYLLHCYYYYMVGNTTDTQSYNTLRQLYAKETISKETWAHPMWFVIHYTSYHCKSIITESWKIAFIALMSTLQTVLPCGACRQHIKENLPANNINNYFINKQEIYRWTFELHNIVNEMLGKPKLSFEESKRIYDPFISPWISQNSKFVKY